ncbi:DUF3237 domain-containing protein [Azospirillum griseum]|nr:DUF3237 domain-containing protein [Azospirillum griseum]
MDNTETHRDAHRDTPTAPLNRRALIRTATLTAGMAATGWVASAPHNTAMASTGGPLSPDIPVVLPKTEFVYEALCDLEPAIDMGNGPLGGRRIINIVGGRFAGPRLRGTVLRGGADRQLLRKDGVRILNALYELQTEDGAVLTVNNRVLIDARPDGTRYAFSHIDLTAPEGPHDWLNRKSFVGTLHSLTPGKIVLIRVYSLE